MRRPNGRRLIDALLLLDPSNSSHLNIWSNIVLFMPSRRRVTCR